MFILISITNENKHLYLWHLVGSFLSYINDARLRETKVNIEKNLCITLVV